MGHSPAPRENVHEFSKYRLREPLSDSFLGTRYRAVSNISGAVHAASNAFGTELNSWRSSAFALRLLRAETATLIDRVARAAKAVRYVDHPNILAPIQLIRAQTKLGVITQDIEGATLTRVMRLASVRGEGLPQPIALRIMLDVLDGVTALHAAEGVTSLYTFACGGLTPDSIHVGSDGRARLLDPGVAGAAASVPHWGHDPVALAYTPPEQTGAQPNFTPRSDVFAIGVMLWEMLAGQSLFGAGTAAETLERLHRGEIPRVQRDGFMRGEPISALVALAVTRALSRQPKQRYPSCAELGSELSGADESASHEQVAEYCRRQPSNSAGAFNSQPPEEGLSESITGPISRIEALQVASLQHKSRQQLPADAFEPRTERMSAPFLQPPNKEEPCSTAFPISDFVPAKASSKRAYAPLAAAAVVLIGSSLFAWQLGRAPAGDAAAAGAGPNEQSSAPARTQGVRIMLDRSSLPAMAETSQSAAAERPPAPAATPVQSQPRAPATPQRPARAPANPVVTTIEPPASERVEITPAAVTTADAAKPKPSEQQGARREPRRNRRRVEPEADLKPMPEPAPASPFIPDDI